MNRLGGWKLVGLTAIAMTAISLALVQRQGLTEETVRLMIRLTARFAVTFFLLAFTASALNRVFAQPWTRALLQNRRYLGVSFAVAHFTHLGCLFALGYWFPHPFRDTLNPVTLLGGGLAYVFLVLMTATSFDRTAALISRRAWVALHTIGSYYIWIIFAQSYIPRAIRDPWYIPFAAALVVGIGLRAYAAIARRLIHAEARAI